jgi:hypothetical protein
MVAGGLPDDFEGTVARVRLRPWDYEGNIDHYVLAVAVDFEPDDGEDIEPFTQMYSCGSLDHFHPSMDGENPVDVEGWDEEDVEEVEGVYALPIGKRTQLNNNTNWATFCGAAADAGFGDIEPNVDCFEGLHGRFNRVPQKKRSGIVKPGQDQKQASDILVLTEMTDAPKAEVRGKATRKPKAAPKAEAEVVSSESGSGGSDDIDSDIEELLIGAIADNDGELKKTKLPGLLMKGFKDSKSRGEAVKRGSNAVWLSDEARPWEFDGDANVLSIG